METSTNVDLRPLIIEAVEVQPLTLAALAEKFGVSTQKIIGSVTVMRKNKEVLYTDGLVSICKSVPLTEPTSATPVTEKPARKPSVKSEKPSIQTADGTVRITKTSLAAGVFNRMYAEGATRKEIIAEMTTVASLTNAGAATYYQNFLNKAKLAVAATTNQEPELPPAE
jgi:hypothetical protein